MLSLIILLCGTDFEAVWADKLVSHSFELWNCAGQVHTEEREKPEVSPLSDTKSDEQQDAVRKVPAPRKFRVLVLTADWCGPCQQLKSRFDWLRSGGWTIGVTPDNHVQTIDVDQQPEAWSRYAQAGQGMPLAVAIDGDRILGRISGVTAEGLIELQHRAAAQAKAQGTP